MAKKTKKSETIIDAEVQEIVPKARKRRPNTKNVEKITEEVEAELNEDNNLSVTPSKKVLSDDGTLNENALTPSKRKYYTEISKVLNEKDMSSISSYGSDLQRAMDTYSSDFLQQSFDSKSSIESAQLISNLLGELHEVDVDDLENPTALKKFLRKVPLLKNLIVSVEQIKAKYNTIQKNIDGIVKKLEAGRQIAIRDNNLLQKQFENNCDYIDQLKDLIIAGRLKSEELEKTIEEMKLDVGEYDDYQISDVEEYKNSLDKRISDLAMIRYAFKQSLTQIRIIQRTNMLNANNVEQQITMTIPLWKNQLSLAVALYDQKQALTVSSKVADATNAIFKKNSEMMKTQAIEVAKQSQRSVIDIDTLRKTTQDLLATVEGVQKAQKEGAEKRAAAEAELHKLEQQMTMVAIGVKDSTQHIIAKELQGRKNNLLEN